MTNAHPPSSPRPPPVPPPTAEGRDALIEGVVHLHGAADSLGRVERHQAAGVARGRPAAWFSKTNPHHDGGLGNGSVAATHSLRAVLARQYPTPMVIVAIASNGQQLGRGHNALRLTTVAEARRVKDSCIDVAHRTSAHAAVRSQWTPIRRTGVPPPTAADVGEFLHRVRIPALSTKARRGTASAADASAPIATGRTAATHRIPLLVSHTKAITLAVGASSYTEMARPLARIPVHHIGEAGPLPLKPQDGGARSPKVTCASALIACPTVRAIAKITFVPCARVRGRASHHTVRVAGRPQASHHVDLPQAVVHAHTHSFRAVLARQEPAPMATSVALNPS